MFIKLNQASSVPIYKQIITQIKYAIVTGALKQNDCLPSIRELSVQLTINPNTVLKAYNELEYEKVVIAKQGQGYFVNQDNILNINKEEKQKIINEFITEMIVEAKHLGFDEESILETIKKKFKEISDLKKHSLRKK